MSSFMGLVVFGGPLSGQTRPWKVKHHLARPRGLTEVVEGCSNGGKALQS